MNLLVKYQAMRESDSFLFFNFAGRIEFWEAGPDSGCLVALNLSRDRSLIRKMEWEMFCTRNDSCCLEGKKQGIVSNLHGF